MPTADELAAHHARNVEWERLRELTHTNNCECGGYLVVAIGEGQPRLRCGKCGFITESQTRRRRSLSQRYQAGEAMPIEIVNRIEAKEEKE